MSTPFNHWSIPCGPVVLDENSVHVWRVPLPEHSGEWRGPEGVLSIDEQEKARRFYFEKDRWHYIATHTALRLLLSQYLEMPPQQIQFGANEYGKPFVIHPAGKPFRFNLTHSRRLALIAVTQAREIGVDVEAMRDDLVDPAVARRFFAASETEALFALPSGQQASGFFSCWTRKEAFIKARGMGLSLPLDQFEVSIAPEDPVVHLSTYCDPQEAQKWSIQALYPGEGYAAALAVEGRSWELCCWQFESH